MSRPKKYNQCSVQTPEKRLAQSIDPSQQVCPMFDHTSILEFPVAPYGEMGVRVVDNCCEEHGM